MSRITQIRNLPQEPDANPSASAKVSVIASAVKEVSSNAKATMPRRVPVARDVILSGEFVMADTLQHTTTLPGTAATSVAVWQPRLLLREQPLDSGNGNQPVLYVHGATFPSANSVMFKLEGASWADELNRAGFSVWALDFAGFGGSEAYPGMASQKPSPGDPLSRAPEAARQIERAARAIIAKTGAANVSIIAHSWGTIATGLCATEHPELVGRLVFFGPIARREALKSVPALGPWRFLTVEEQHKRFVEDVPAGHPPVLIERDFPTWAELYLNADPTSGSRTPPSVKTPNGPLADIMAAWSGSLAYDPSRIRSPVAIIRGEWDSLCTEADAAWLLAALTSAPETKDTKIASGTHLMHLEQSRGELHRASADFLSGK
jgi:pimeloyl-ACP methyl ester carboxylesterase